MTDPTTQRRKRRSTLFPFSLGDMIKTVLILGAASAVSWLLQQIDDTGTFAPMIFVLAVFLVSRFTDGYLFGLIASFAGVILANYAFTYPYRAFDFSISGYPITFISMLATSVMTSTMTTRIKQHESIRLEAEKEKMRGNLLRAVSHDLRTPLTSILGTTSALLDNGDRIGADKQCELLREAHDEAEWLIRMVENLLSVTRISGEQASIAKAPEAVEEIVGEAVRKLNKRFPDAKIEVAVPDELLMVPMDAMLIEQVLLNLLENAVVHGGRADGISISVSEDGDNAVFRIRDSGAGIPDESFAHLFDGYLSGSDGDGSDSSRSMGIGLSVCMSIVKAHGGTMAASNIHGGGAEFRFLLPFKED